MNDVEYQVSSELHSENDYISDIKPTYDKKNVVSKFKFIIPKTLEKDKDGDFLVVRKGNTDTHLIEIEHSTSTILSLVGLQIWRGALLLADWLIYNNKQLPKDSIILELGSGVGFTSIVAARYRPVVCTDINKGGLLELIRHNVFRNKTIATNSCQVLELDFLAENFSAEIEEILPKVKVVLAADVVYDDMITKAFVSTIKKLLSTSPSRSVYVALEKRYVFTIADCDTAAPCYEYFLERLDELKGVKKESVPLDFPQYFEYDRVKELVLWKLSSNFP